MSIFKNIFSKPLEPDLMEAIESNNFEKTRILLKDGANINYRGEKGNTPLIRSLNCADSRISKLLIDSGANVNLSTDNGYSPLLVSCTKNNIVLVKLFINKGANVHQKTKEGHSSLEFASENPSFFFDANDKGPDNIPYQELLNILYKSANYQMENEPSEIVNLLLQTGANPNDATLTGYTPLMGASINANHKTIQCLLKYNASTDLRDEHGNTALHYAVLATVELYFKELINPKGAVKTTFGDSFSLSMIAALKPKFENSREICVTILINNGANIHAIDDQGVNILTRASETGNYNVVKKLVDAGANVFTKNSIGWSPIFGAATGGHNMIITYFISLGVDINIESQGGETPLMTAVWYGHVDTVKMLIQKGANVKCKKITPQNPTGEYPLEWAVIKYKKTNDPRYMEIGQLLINAGAILPEKYR